MATKRIKPENYIGIELDLAEQQLGIYKTWLEENPYDKFAERVIWKETKGGGQIPIVAATIESQQKNHRETLKDFLSLSSVVNDLREKKQKQEELRKGFTNEDVLDD